MDDLIVRMGLDNVGFISGLRSTEQQTLRSMQNLDNAYKAAARSEKGLSDAQIERRAKNLANLGAQQSEIDQFVEAAKASRAYKAELARVETQYGDNKRALNQYMAEFGQANNLLSLSEIRTRELAAANRLGAVTARQHANAAARQSKGLRQVSTSADGAISKLKALAAAGLGLAGVSGLAKTADDWTTINNRLKLVIDSESDLLNVRNQLMASANATGQSLGGVADLYSKLSQSQEQTGVSGERLIKLMDTINKAMVIGGGSAQSQEAALIQLSQAMSSGTLRGEELNSVLEQAPGLAQAIAKGMGVSVGQLRKLAAEGLLTSKAVAESLLSVSGSVGEQYGKMDRTIGQSFTALKNNVTAYIGDSAKSSGATKLAAGSIELLSRNLNTAATAVTVLAGAYAAKYITGVTSAIIVRGAELALQARSIQVVYKEAGMEGVLALAKQKSAQASGVNAAAKLAEARASAALSRQQAIEAATRAAANGGGAGAGAAGGLAKAGRMLGSMAGIAGMFAGGIPGIIAGVVGLGVTLSAAALSYKAVTNASKDATTAMQQQLPAVEDLKKAFEEKTQVEQDAMVGDYQNKYAENLKKYRSAVKEMGKGVTEALYEQNYAGNIAKVAAEAKGVMDAMEAGALSATEGLKILREELNLPVDSQLYKDLAAQAVKAEKLAKDTNAYGASLGALGKEVKPLKTSIKEAGNVVTETSDGLKDGANGAKTMSQSLAELETQAKKTAEAMKKLKQQETDAIANKVLQFGLMKNGLSSDSASKIAQASLTGMSGQDLKDYRQQVLQNEQLQKQIANLSSVNDTLNRMRTEVDETTIKMKLGEEGLLAYQLAQKDATDAQIEQALATAKVAEQLKRQEQNQKTITDLQNRAAEMAAELQGGTNGLIAFQMASNHATEQQIRQAQAANGVIEQYKRQQEVMQTLEGLEDTVAKLGMSDSQKQLYDLSKKGASPAELARAQALLAQIDGFKQAQEATQAASRELSKGSRDSSDAARKLSGAADKLKGSDDALDTAKGSRHDEWVSSSAKWDEIRKAERESDSISIITNRKLTDLIPAVNKIASQPPLSSNLTGGLGKIGSLGGIEPLTPRESMTINLMGANGQSTNFLAIFDTPAGKKQFKNLLRTNISEMARDLN